VSDVVFAVDGGNSKTDLALVRSDGAVLSLVRGPLSSPHHLGLEGSLEVLRELWERAVAEAQLAQVNGPIAAVGRLCMAGVDFPAEEEVLQERIAALGWARRTSVANDTYAVLWAGTDHGWGVGVVCGAGINCVAVAPDGRQVRFPALGEITGDWGGGNDVGMAALSAAARSEDGRGPKTTLEATVPAHFGLTTPLEVAEAMHLEKIARRRVVELPPLVFAEAEHDLVAAGIVERLTLEIVALVRASLTRLDMTQEHVQVALGGGLARNMSLDAMREQLREIGPHIEVRLTQAPPVLGAALSALDEVGAGADAQARVRKELAHG
jgi:N-acetylglucosamine kinase-like BadF-type ATPase